MQNGLQPLLDHLSACTTLPPEQGRRLVEDVLAWFSETVEDWVARRHGELQAGGVRNEEIFKRIEVELQQRRFAATPLSTRQIRRLIYG